MRNTAVAGGDFHFADALDLAPTDDGKPIDTNFMDFQENEYDDNAWQLQPQLDFG